MSVLDDALNEAIRKKGGGGSSPASSSVPPPPSKPVASPAPIDHPKVESSDDIDEGIKHNIKTHTIDSIAGDLDLANDVLRELDKHHSDKNISYRLGNSFGRISIESYMRQLLRSMEKKHPEAFKDEEEDVEELPPPPSNTAHVSPKKDVFESLSSSKPMDVFQDMHEGNFEPTGDIPPTEGLDPIAEEEDTFVPEDTASLPEAAQTIGPSFPSPDENIDDGVIESTPPEFPPETEGDKVREYLNEEEEEEVPSTEPESITPDTPEDTPHPDHVDITVGEDPPSSPPPPPISEGSISSGPNPDEEYINESIAKEKAASRKNTALNILNYILFRPAGSSDPYKTTASTQNTPLKDFASGNKNEVNNLRRERIRYAFNKAKEDFTKYLDMGDQFDKKLFDDYTTSMNVQLRMAEQNVINNDFSPSKEWLKRVMDGESQRKNMITSKIIHLGQEIDQQLEEESKTGSGAPGWGAISPESMRDRLFLNFSELDPFDQRYIDILCKKAYDQLYAKWGGQL